MLECLTFSGCNKKLVLINYGQKNQEIHQKIETNNVIDSIIQPYKSSIDKSMAKTIGLTGSSLFKAKPESSLGNCFADLLLNEIKALTEEKIDIAVINYGGLRIPSIEEGPIQLGLIYELMPFDNYVVLQELNGEQLALFIDSIAGFGGWPISGLEFLVKNEQAINIKVGGKPFDISKTYKIAISDYIANGGDNMELLESIPQVSTGYLLRDVFVSAIERKYEREEAISGNLDGRIRYVE